MENLLRLFASLAGFLDPRRVDSIKTGRVSGKSCRKSLIINNPILHPPSKSSGNVRFYTFTLTPIPSLSEVIRGFALKPVLQAWQEWKTRTVTPALTGRCNTPQSLHRVAPCCSVLHRVSTKIFQPSGATPSTFPTEPGRCMVVLPGCAPAIASLDFRLVFEGLQTLLRLTNSR